VLPFTTPKPRPVEPFEGRNRRGGLGSFPGVRAYAGGRGPFVP
jgi:hypothetical protein